VHTLERELVAVPNPPSGRRQGNYFTGIRPGFFNRLKKQSGPDMLMEDY